MTTTTILRPDTTTRTSSADALRELMHDALSVAADDAVSFDGGTVPGRTLLALSAVARQAVRALGADPGIMVLSGPGVVVVRDFVAAVRLLDSAAGTSDQGNLDGLLAMAKGLHAQLHETVSRTA